MQEGITGFPVPPGGSAGMAQAIVSLAQDPKKAEAMGQAGAVWAQERFSVASQVQNYLEWYQELKITAANPRR
jgi:glycosyltransferase involved in cell wall biosynthesis